MTAGVDGVPKAPMENLVSVAVSQIDGRLVKAWRDVATKEQRPLVHTCAMTLIICLEDEHDNKPALEVVNRLAGKHPIRAITVQFTRDAGDEVFAWIGAGCGEEQETESICSEEIVLQGSKRSPQQIVSAVRGLLVADLPVLLWWRGGSPLDEPLWGGLQPMCDRLIVDSIRFGDGAAALDSLRGLVAAVGMRTTVRDLNWQRTAPWRAAVASCFDDREMLSLLDDIDRCSITFAGGDHPEPPSARSLLIAGWLASRLPRLRGNCKTAQGKRWKDVASGRIVALTLTSSKNKTALMLVRHDAPTGIVAQAHRPSGEQFRRWEFRAASLLEAELLDGCIDSLARDPIFESSL